MKFISSVQDLQDPVNKVFQACPSKTMDPRFEHIHMSVEPGKLTLSGSDGELSITTTVVVETEDSFVISINAKTLQDFLRGMYDTSLKISVEREAYYEHGVVQIMTDKGKYKIPCIFDNKFDIQERDYITSFGLPASEFLSIIQKTIFACSLDGMRPSMMGVLFEVESGMVTAVSTDGHRLVRYRYHTDVNIQEKIKIVISSRVLSILLKCNQVDSMEISIDAEKRFVRFASGNLTTDASLIVEPFPNYDAVIPLDHNKIVSINRLQLLDSVRRVGKFSGIGDIKFQLVDNKVNIIAENSTDGEVAVEELSGTYDEEEIVIGFNAKFIEAALSHIDHENIRMELKSPTTAVLFKPDTEDEKKVEDFMILVMPIRINC